MRVLLVTLDGLDVLLPHEYGGTEPPFGQVCRRLTPRGYREYRLVERTDDGFGLLCIYREVDHYSEAERQLAEQRRIEFVEQERARRARQRQWSPPTWQTATDTWDFATLQPVPQTRRRVRHMTNEETNE